MGQIISPGGINANLAPDAFHLWASHYYRCRADFLSPDPFSPVPYFLLCRAIELELKARHLTRKTQAHVKRAFGHNLIKAYTALDVAERILGHDEVKTLRLANDIYSGKGFEYFNPEDALTGYSRYPDLKALDAVAAKLIGVSGSGAGGSARPGDAADLLRSPAAR